MRILNSTGLAPAEAPLPEVQSASAGIAAGTGAPGRTAAAPSGEAAARRALAGASRIVIKIGTNTIMRQKGAPARISAGPAPDETADGGIDVEYLYRVAAAVASLMRGGREILIVTSGAVGMGSRELGLKRRAKDLVTRQACAAIGQPLLMDEYRRAFAVFGLCAAQLLVTRDVWDNRSAYLNLRSTVESLLESRIVPIFNENDTISTAEIGNAFGDNDRLSAYVASKIDADLLVLLSDVSSLYSADPREASDAKPILYVNNLSPEILAAAGGRGSEFSTGGMKSKLAAVAIARDAGCRVVIAQGREQDIIRRILAGEEIGTLFDAEGGLKNRLRWLKNSQAQGSIEVDEGALAAMRAKKSLLPSGIRSVKGSFDSGAVVLVNGSAKIVSAFSSTELIEILGRKSAEVAQILGEAAGHIVARPEDTVFLD